MNKQTTLLLSFFLICFASLAHGTEKKQIVFIVNPISHEIQHLDVQEIIDNNLDHQQFDYKIIYTQYPGHATELAKEFSDTEMIVAAVGGDGTVNEVGKALVNTKAVLAIVPVGSGNGLARHLGIPIGLHDAIRALNFSHQIVMDVAKINDQIFLGVAGIGFDALIAHEFAQYGKRGLWSYCQVAMKEFSQYSPHIYRINIDGKQITRRAFVLTFANSSQYGNDFIIAPQARVTDGFLDLVIIDDISMLNAPRLLYKLKQGTLNRSSHYESFRFKELTIEGPFFLTHIDGEPAKFYEKITVSILPKTLKVFVVSRQ